MRILLVEPEYRKGSKKIIQNHRKSLAENSSNRPDDETLWYPPLGLMKLATYHKLRGDEVKFVSGCDNSVIPQGDMFSGRELWDRVYITTLFTFHFVNIIKTINFYKEAVGGTTRKIFVGGIMSSLMPEDIFEETGIFPIPGVLLSAKQIQLDDDTNIDSLPPDYSILDGYPYAVNNTYYGYTSRGCINKCAWCGVPKIEPQFQEYVDIKPVIQSLRAKNGDFSRLKLMDNNVLASPSLPRIVADLVELGYSRDSYVNTRSQKQRVVDFNQGVDASFINHKTLSELSKLNIKPLRIAFDRLSEQKEYIAAIELAISYGFSEFSNYMLYNFNDTPFDLFKRITINIELNEKYCSKSGNLSGKIYCYPMRYAPINERGGAQSNRKRDLFKDPPVNGRDWLNDPAWTRRFVRNIEVMKSAAHGAISPTYSLARRTIGHNFEEFIANLYMPEELLRYRNKHEKKVYEFEPKRNQGTGKVEEFRAFILKLLEKQDEQFIAFHSAVTPNNATHIRRCLKDCKDREISKWLKYYLTRQ